MARLSGPPNGSPEDDLPEIEVLVVWPQDRLLAADSPLLIQGYWLVLDDSSDPRRRRISPASASPPS